jgi:hypothetical protein
MTKNATLGHRLETELAQALNVFKAGPVLADHRRHVLSGVSPRGDALNRLLDDVLAEATNILVHSRKVYRFGNSIMLEESDGETGTLTTLAVDFRAETHASAQLTNLLAVSTGNSESFTQSSVPPRFAASLLESQSLRKLLPEIRLYCRRPAFDQDFGWKGPGYHEASGLLIHGPQITPHLSEPKFATSARAVDRLSPCLAQLLREFPWQSDADLVNFVAALLTGLLCNHFVDEPHPIVVIDGNQSSIGKTLLIQCMGRILDGIEPPRITLSWDEELEKKLCAHIRTSGTSLIFLDNVLKRIASEVIEQNALSPILRFRILGTSSFIERPNCYLWVVTSNLPTAASDVVTRGLPIRLSVDGDPKLRKFAVRALKFAQEHRLQILGELAGMVLLWLQKGKRPGAHRHRCDHWASVIGGILEECGLGGFFLGNLDEAAAEMDEGLSHLGALAEYVLKNPQEKLIHWPEGVCDEPKSADSVPLGGSKDAGGMVKGPAELGLSPGQWVPVFDGARLLWDKQGLTTERSKATTVGQFLSKMVDRPVTVEWRSEEFTLHLRKRPVRSNKNLFYFEARALKSPPVSEAEEVSGDGDPDLGASEPADGPKEGPQGTPSPDDISTNPKLEWL